MIIFFFDFPFIYSRSKEVNIHNRVFRKGTQKHLYSYKVKRALYNTRIIQCVVSCGETEEVSRESFKDKISCV